MGQKKCEETINGFLQLDKNEKLGFQTTIHLLSCKRCRTVVRLCTLAQRSSSRPLHIPASLHDNNVSQIVQSANPTIELLKDSHAKPISMIRWVASGIILVLAILTFGIKNTIFTGLGLQITIYLCFSAFLCGYCAFFVGSNLDFFVKQIEKKFLP